MNYLLSFLSLFLIVSITKVQGESGGDYVAFGRVFGKQGDESDMSDEGLRFLSDDLSMSMDNTPAPIFSPQPTAAPTVCELTDGTTFTFDSYIMESDAIFDDVYVHHQFRITVKCDCNGKAVNGGTVGPTIETNLLEEAPVDGPIVQTVNNKDLQVDWEGSALEGDAPGWSIVATGAGLCFTPAAKAGVCLVVAGLAAEVFDDEVLWGYRRSVSFKCVESGDSWNVEMKENGSPLEETFKTNESEFYTDYSSTSAAAAGLVSAQEKLFDVTNKTVVSGANVAALSVTALLLAVGAVIGAMEL